MPGHNLIFHRWTEAGRRDRPQDPGRDPGRGAGPAGRRRGPGGTGRQCPGRGPRGTGSQRQAAAGEWPDVTLVSEDDGLPCRTSSWPRRPWWPSKSRTPPSSTCPATSRRPTTGRSRRRPPWTSTSSPTSRASRGKGRPKNTPKIREKMNFRSKTLVLNVKAI